MTTNVGDIIRVAPRMTSSNSGDLVNVYHFKLTGPGSLSDADMIDDMCDLMDAMYDVLDTSITDEISFSDINVFNVTQDTPHGPQDWPTLTAGSNQAVPLPSQTAAFIQTPTGLSRSWGRKFLGGFTTDHLSQDGNIATGFLAVLVSFANVWLNQTGVTLNGTWEPVIYSTIDLSWRAILSATVNNIWATIRRRRVGVGA